MDIYKALRTVPDDRISTIYMCEIKIKLQIKIILKSGECYKENKK